MKIADVPSRFNIPFADAAGGGYIRPVPEASQIGITDGAASLTDGFPPLNFLPVGAGGVPPFGQDMNGLMKQVTEWSQWQAAGGTASYNSAFSTAIGGYPKNAVIMGASGAYLWQNLVDDNTSDPEAGGANWTPLVSARTLQNGSFVFASATGSANALVAALSPALPAAVAGLSIRIAITANNTGAATLNAGYGAQPINTLMGVVTPPNFLRSGAIVEFIDNGAGEFIAMSGAGYMAGDTTAWYSVTPSGVVSQGGLVYDIVNSNGTITYPTAFPNALFSYGAWNISSSVADSHLHVSAGVATLTTMPWRCSNGTSAQPPEAFLWSVTGY